MSIKKRIFTGLLIGVIAGVIDVTPMILMKLTWDANLSAFTMWLVIGFLLAITHIRLKGFIKGLIIACTVLLPNLFIIGWKEPESLMPGILITAVLGSLSGFVFDKIAK